MSPKTITFLLISIAPLLLPMLCSSSSSNFSACWGLGDVVTDTGNNNFISTFFRANFRPYGRDFPNMMPTGRFTNGKNSLDFICSGLGIKDLVPPYLNSTLANDKELLTGVSFGSGGSGYDPLTSRTSNSIPMSTQIALFENVLERMNILFGEEMTDSIVENSLFTVTAGTADFALFYDLRVRSLQFDISGYQDFVLQHVESTIRRLYNLGARRLLVSNLPPVGCLPIQITFSGDIYERKCVTQQNDDSVTYNGKFKLLLSRMEQELQNSTIVLYDFYNPNIDAINNPAKYRVEVTTRGCCGSGLFEIGLACMEPLATACNDSSKYIFWDALNPTERISKLLSDVALKAIRSKFSS